MAPLIMDRLAAYATEAEAGPPLWRGSLRRTIEVVRPAWTGKDVTWDGFVLVEGAVGIALTMYILAAQRDVAPEEITRADVEQFCRDGKGGRSLSYWEAELVVLGHDLTDDAHDDIARRWRELSRDLSPPPELPEDAYEDIATLFGPMLANGLENALGPPWKLIF